MAKKVLGRGLGAFFPEYQNDPTLQDAEHDSGVERPSPADAAGGGAGEKGVSAPSAPSASTSRNAAKHKGAGSGDADPATQASVQTSQEPIDPYERINVVLEIPVQDIRPNPHQPRLEFEEVALGELADSIRLYGLIQPVTVRYIGERRFELISGERRLRASKLAGMKVIPAYVREADDEQIISMALVENIQREELNPLEVALGYQRLIEECSYTQAEVADKVGVNRTTVTNMLRLLQLPVFIQAALQQEEITTGHARALITLQDEELQKKALRKILKEGLSVRQVEELVGGLDKKADSQKRAPKKAALPAFLTDFSKRLRSSLGTKVDIRPKGEGGEIRIEYYTSEDLDRLIHYFDKAD